MKAMMIEIRKRLMLATTDGNSNNKRRFDPVKQKPPNNDNSGYFYSALPRKRDADTSFDSHEDDSDSESVPRLMSPEEFMQPNHSSIHTGILPPHAHIHTYIKFTAVYTSCLLRCEDVLPVQSLGMFIPGHPVVTVITAEIRHVS